MAFSAKQLQSLKRNPHHRNIRKREAHGRELSYIEGWYAVAEANRIFGFDSWSRETTDSKCVFARETRGTFNAVYLARVRISVQADGTTIIREGHGTGEGRGTSPGEVHDIAVKAAETDATKRALATFGRPFGLELYRNGRSAPSPAQASSQDLQAAPQPLSNGRFEPHFGFHPDDTTPIPRPSRYYGRRDQSPNKEPIRDTDHKQQNSPAEAPPLAPVAPEAGRGRIDKSQLTISEPKRLRDRAHLNFVASQPCLICGRQPSDPHHLRFAQPRAIGLKVSDEFTVPLCRGHHRQLHQAVNELAWWANLRVAPLEIAKKLWDESHAKKTFTIDAGTAEASNDSSAGSTTSSPHSKS